MHFRADHVGSLLRPPALLEARRAHAEGRITLEALRALEDESILEALDTQRSTGIEVLSDGEYRRGGWSEAWAASLEGLVPNTGSPVGLPVAWQGGESEARQQATPPPNGSMPAPGRMVVGEKLRLKGRITAHESSFLAKHARAPFKITMPGITMFATTAYKPGVSDSVYATRMEMCLELAALMRAEIEALIAEGVSYIQLDSLRYVLPLADPLLRQKMIDEGEDPQVLLDETIATDNACLEGIDRSKVTIALHMCRGNLRSAWGAAGAYDYVAQKALSQLNVDRFLLEYDDERSGSFEALRFVPKGKTVVLGLITSKRPELESIDSLRKRIDEAAVYVPLEDLAISPQCGFASVIPGNLLTMDDQRRKLELVVETARQVWGNS
jgi:5-methyltetrahydropteroyltriglutamate--homocysteine methyltransferase